MPQGEGPTDFPDGSLYLIATGLIVEGVVAYMFRPIPAVGFLVGAIGLLLDSNRGGAGLGCSLPCGEEDGVRLPR